MKESRPHFICIGAQRSGTSWLYECFLEHPDIFMPQKEMHFFDRKPLSEIDSYRKRFGTEDKICGEITPDYLSSESAIEKIAKSCPSTKLIIILRNPVERTQSSFQLYKERGVTKDETLEDVYTNRSIPFVKSLYGQQIEFLFSMFDKKNVKVVFFDRIKTEPESLIRELFEFIGVRSNVVLSSLDKNFNASSIGLGSISTAKKITEIQNFLVRRHWGKKILKVKKHKWFKKLKDSLIEKSRSQTNEASSQYRVFFKEDLALLEKLLDTSVPSSWKS